MERNVQNLHKWPEESTSKSRLVHSGVYSILSSKCISIGVSKTPRSRCLVHSVEVFLDAAVVLSFQ